jgi:hypothetical protein
MVELSGLTGLQQTATAKVVCPNHAEVMAEVAIETGFEEEPDEPCIELTSSLDSMNADGQAQARFTARVLDGWGRGISGCFLKLSLEPARIGRACRPMRSFQPRA